MSGQVTNMNATNFARWIFKMTLTLVLATAATSATAHAQSGEAARAFWMAASSNEAVLTGNTWGRLGLLDGVLTFQSSNYSWSVALSEITRVESSKETPRAFVIESASGGHFYVGILDGTMTLTSPGKAIQKIQRAVREAPAAASRAAMAAAGGSDR